MDATAFLARVEDYHKDGWRLALINVTTMPRRGAAAAARAGGSAAPAPAVPAESAEATPTP
jgi:hypothetical protein